MFADWLKQAKARYSSPAVQTVYGEEPGETVTVDGLFFDEVAQEPGNAGMDEAGTLTAYLPIDMAPAPERNGRITYRGDTYTVLSVKRWDQLAEFPQVYEVICQ